jgi:hypothetical protein
LFGNCRSSTRERSSSFFLWFAAIQDIERNQDLADLAPVP